MNVDDPLWPEFNRLWPVLRHVDNLLVVAGGYGLFLKQLRLQQNPELRTVVPVNRWSEATPRATKDIDLVIGVDLIADESRNVELARTLLGLGYRTSESNPRWQFEKLSSTGHPVVVELHASSPAELPPNVESSLIRIKHTPSLRDRGVHARRNQEAIGGRLHPFEFERDGLLVRVPNPVTWSVMKLAAMKDCWDRSRNDEFDAVARGFYRDEAVKHSQDTCRIAAMMTLEERDHCAAVIAGIADSTSFVEAKQIFGDFHRNEGVELARGLLPPAEMQIVLDVLSEWYR